MVKMNICDLISEIRENEVEPLGSMELDEKERIDLTVKTFAKLKNEGAETQMKKIPRRKLIVLAAAVIAVLAFGVVAYATDLFGFGKIIYMGEEVEVASLEESSQYKAMAEYRKYVDQLSMKETELLYKQYRWGQVLVPEKAKELCEKYDLKFENNWKFAENANEAVKKAGAGDFLGEFPDTGKGQYVYGEYGTIEIVQDVNGNYFDMTAVPGDVFREIDIWNIDPLSEEWTYTTKDGYAAKCAMFPADADDREEICYAAVVPAGKYIISLVASVPADNDTKNSHTYIEELLDMFDFNECH